MAGKLCEMCKKVEASVHFKQVCDGEVRELDVCRTCAEKHGFSLPAPMAMSDFLFGVGMDTEKGAALKDKSCPACHMRSSDLRKTSRFGCPRCYETFAEELAPLLAELQTDTVHRGKVPAREQARSRAEALRRELDAAVNKQNFEDAARLRDAIRAIEAEGELS